MSLYTSNIQSTESQRPDLRELKSWLQEYLAINPFSKDRLESGETFLEAPSLRSVDSDELDSHRVETSVRQLISNSDVEEHLCHQCRHLLQNWPDLVKEEWDHAVGRPCRTDEIAAASRAGCVFCTFLFSVLRARGLLDIFRKIERRFQLLNHDGTSSLAIQNWGSPGRIQTLWINFPGRADSSCNSRPARLTKFYSHILSPTAALSHNNLNYDRLAETWLNRCLKSHGLCCSTSSFERPTRLVSIQSDRLRIVLTAPWKTMPEYATLSYCWGQGGSTLLTEENLQSFMDSFPMTDLPQTFKDAIQFARRLGLGYIWIDALCIIQNLNDNSDWQRESSLMRSIYGGSHVTIAASSAASVHEGLFTAPSHHSGSVCTRVSTARYSQVRNFHIADYNTLANNSLAHRAWALQERLLSTRILHFTAEGLFWECRSSFASDFFTDGFEGLFLGPQLLCADDKAYEWDEITQRFSSADLTYGSDRLPALAGVARRQSGVIQDQYLAGMWKSTLILQLPWQRTSDKRKRPPWRAPTWSWMAIDGPVAYGRTWETPQLTQDEYIQILDAWTQPSGCDPYGAVSGGALLVKCSALVCGRLREGPSSPEKPMFPVLKEDSVLLDGSSKHFPIVLDCLEDEASTQNREVYLLPLIRGGGITVRDTEGEQTGNETGSSGSVETRIDNLQVCGLVLRKINETEHCFYRLGYFAFHRPENYWSTMQGLGYDEFINILNNQGVKPIKSHRAGFVPGPENGTMYFNITVR